MGGEEGPRPRSTLLAGISIPHYSLLEAQDAGALAIFGEIILVKRHGEDAFTSDGGDAIP